MDALSLLLGVLIVLISVAMVRMMDSSPIPIVIQTITAPPSSDEGDDDFLGSIRQVDQ